MKQPIAILAGLVLCGSVPEASAETPPPKARPAQTCFFDAWSEDRTGQPVRSGPSANSPVVGRLAPYGPEPLDPERDTGPGFDIVASRDGWFYITSAFFPDGEPGPEEEGPVPHPIEGWISGADVRFSIQSEIGFVRPDPKSRRVWASRRGERTFTRVLACSGEWAKVEWRDRGRLRSGWFRGLCANQDTSCGGAGGDWIGRPGKSRSGYPPR